MLKLINKSLVSKKNAKFVTQWLYLLFKMILNKLYTLA